MSMREFLLETIAFLPPPRVIEQLTPAQASARPAGAAHTIAEIVGHMHFWQTWFLKRCRGVAEPMVASASTGWPPVSADDWDGLREAFVAGLNEAASLSDDASRVSVQARPADRVSTIGGVHGARRAGAYGHAQRVSPRANRHAPATAGHVAAAWRWLDVVRGGRGLQPRPAFGLRPWVGWNGFEESRAPSVGAPFCWSGERAQVPPPQPLPGRARSTPDADSEGNTIARFG